MKDKTKNQSVKRTFIGGQAVLEGVMMRGKTAMAIAVRNYDGDILMETERIKPKKKVARLPILRGVVAFVNSLVMGISTITKAANALGDEDEQLGAGGMAFAVIFGLVLALGIFFFLPGLVSGFFYEKIYRNILVKNLVSGVLRVGLFVGYLALVSRLKDIRRTFMYHGAEHRTINCFEKGLPLTVENVQSCSTRHNRCGTTFMFLVMMISIIVFAFVDWALITVLPMKEGILRQLAFMGIKLLFLPLVAGLSFEVLFLFAKLPDGWFATMLRAPGLALQRLSTIKPDDDMAEVAIISFMAVLNMDSDPSIAVQTFDQVPVATARKAIDKVLAPLGAEPAEADWLLCEVTGLSRGGLAALEYVDRKQMSRLHELLTKRKEMPLDYCLGRSCFFGHDVKVDSRVLIPRMETEILAEKALAVIGEKMGGLVDFSVLSEQSDMNKSDINQADRLILQDGAAGECEVLDLCCGSGCIALALAKRSSAAITALDISADALAVAAENLRGLGVELVQSDLFDGLAGRKFDLIVSNPPYIATADIDGLQSEVKCQPIAALDGGQDGLDFYRRIAASALDFLKPDGVLLLEVGFDQAQAVCDLLGTAGLKGCEIIKDLEGVDRVVCARV